MIRAKMALNRKINYYYKDMFDHVLKVDLVF